MKIVGHKQDPTDPNKRLYRVRWLGYTAEDDTYQTEKDIPYNTVFRYCKKKKLSLPQERSSTHLHQHE